VPANCGFCKFYVRLYTPNLNNLGAKSPIVSGLHLKYSRFLETTTRDRIRSALRSRVAVFWPSNCPRRAKLAGAINLSARDFRYLDGASLRREELTLDVEHVDPLEGLLQLFDFMNGHFERNGHLVSLLRTENLMKARYMKKSSCIHEMSSPVLSMTERLLSRGVAEGKLAADIDPL
jgi:hypothetical protein